jgi:phosphodiesterase/alkaline phosphatase D-like protein
MKKYLFILTFTINSLWAAAQTFTEILGRPTNTSITVSFLFDSQVDIYIEYGALSGNYTASTPVATSAVGQPVVTTISGLLEETRYFYRTRYRKVGTSTFLAGTEHKFITQRKKGSQFVFTIEADPHPYDPKGYHPLWDICLKNQLNDGADFMLDLGDTFGDDHLDKVTNLTRTSDQIKQLMLDNRPHFGSVCHSMPFFFCQGNHEGESGYYLLQTPPNNLATYETLWRKMYYPNPEPDGFYTGNNEEENFGMGKPQNYYAFEWGDALFVVVDGWRYYTANVKPRNWEWTIGKTQYDWLKQTLETSKANYKFVFTHHVMGETRGGIGVAKGFEWGGMDNGTDKFANNRPGWELPIHQLMVKNKVNVLFQGHDHVYAYESLDKLVYQTVPMPSDSSYALGYIANGDAFTGTVLKGAGHIRVIVNPDSVKVDFVSAKLPKDETVTSKNGNILYSYSVKSSTISELKDVSLNHQSYFLVYPNQDENKFNILFNQSFETGFTVRVSDLNGRIINEFCSSENIYSGQTKSFKLADKNDNKICAGVYVISVLSKTFMNSSKLLIL